MSANNTSKNSIKLEKINEENLKQQKQQAFELKLQRAQVQSPTKRKKQPVVPQAPSINQQKKKLDDLIQDLNGKLVQHFKMKQQALLNQYKQQLIEQQQKLTELKNTTNQQQIRAKMLQRKTQLQRERNHLIQTNMFFSQKCENYKQTYTKLVQQSKDLQKQLQFLDAQIQAATAKKYILTDQKISTTQRVLPNVPLYTQKKHIISQKQLGTDKNPKSTLQKSYNTNSVRKIAQSLHVTAENKHKKSASVKTLAKINRGAFEKSPLQRIFEQCIQQIKNRRKTKRTMPILKGQQFTQFQKRAIMEIFLGNQQVKRKLYQIIFTEGEKNYRRPLPIGDKVKISFDEAGL